MVMRQSQVTELLQEQLLPIHLEERKLLDRIDGWLRFKPEPIKARRTKDREVEWLKDISNTPWPRLIIRATAQGMKVEGVYARNRKPEELDPMWAPWDANDMALKAPALHRAMLSYGYAYTLVTPGEPHAVINTLSPRNFIALYADPVEDEYPMFGLRRIMHRGSVKHYRVYDEDHVYFLSGDESSGKFDFIDVRAHGMGVCPVVQYSNDLDLEGRTPGEIEPLIPMFARINKTDYDRMLVQHFNSWKIRTATGLDKPTSKQEQDEEKMRLRHDDMLVGGEDVQFGTLDETSMDPFVKAHDSDIEALAAASQTTTTAFGKIVNVSAEGLQEARASMRAKTEEKKVAAGAGHVRTLRLSAHAEGRHEDAVDTTVHAKWADMDAMYLAQAVDALGKAATMLGVPPRLLWDRIPGVDFTEAASWAQYADEHPSAEERQANAVESALNPAV